MESAKEAPRLFGEALLGSATPAEFLGGVIQSSTGYSFIVKDLAGKILLWNLGAQLLYGYSPDEVIGQPSDMLHAPEDIHAELPRKMRETALEEGKWEGVISRITKDQLRLSCRVVMTPYSHDSGKPRGFVLTSRDVSTEFRLRERISRKSLFDVDAVGSSPDDLLEFIISLIQASTLYSIIGTAADGRIILWSEGARRIYGYEPVEVVGKANIAMLHAEEDQEAGLPQKILGTALQGGAWEGEVMRLRKDGSRFAARVTATPRFDAERRLLGFLIISQPTHKAQPEPDSGM